MDYTAETIRTTKTCIAASTRSIRELKDLIRLTLDSLERSKVAIRSTDVAVKRYA